MGDCNNCILNPVVFFREYLNLNKQECSRKVCWSDWRLTVVPQEMLSGVVVISSKDSVQHQGVSLTMEGTVNLQLSAKSVGVFEAFYNSVKVRAKLSGALPEHVSVWLLCPASRHLYVSCPWLVPEEICIDLTHPREISEECLCLVVLTLLYQTFLLALYTAPVEFHIELRHTWSKELFYYVFIILDRVYILESSPDLFPESHVNSV